MQTTKPIDFNCPACGQRSQAAVVTIIDPAHNPQAKSQLLAGALNSILCPNCGNRSTASTPLVYHDASKELFITFVPMQLNMNETETDRFIGVLTREVTDSLEGKMIKGYILQPRRALTMQGFIEQVLEADGVTKEMMDAQKERSRLAQMFMQTDPATYEALVAEHDDKLNMEFFQTMSLMAQRYMQEGRQELADEVLLVQQRIAELSTVGQDLIKQTELQEGLVREVAQLLQGLGERPTPADVVALVRPYAEDDDRLQAFVGLARPLFEYNFFEELTSEISKAPAAERPKLEAMRDTILQLTQMLDQQSQMQVQAVADLLRQILTSQQPEAVIRANLNVIDDNFMAILEMNINEAEKQGDIGASSRLKSIRDTIMTILRENMHPSVRFVSDLLSAESEAKARELIQAEAATHGSELFDVFDALIGTMQAQGQTMVVDRLTTLRGIIDEVLKSS
jgi:hypothetical protein